MKNILLLFFAATTIIACSKNNSGKNTTAITMESLAGNYKITSATYDGTDILSLYLPSCQQDDIYTLSVNGTYAIVDAGVMCTPTSATTGTWSLSGNAITIGSQQFTIISFDGTKITATTTASQNGTTVTVTIVFTKQ